MSDTRIRDSRELDSGDVLGRVRELEAENAALQERLTRLTHVETLAAERARLIQLIADRLPSMIAYWDHNERCQFANGAYKDWFGITPEELRGKTLRQLLGETLYRMNEPYIRAALDRGETQHFERVLRTPSGEIRHSQALYIPDVQGGEVRGMFVLVTDVSRLKQTEIDLEEANARLQRETITDQLSGLYNRRYFTTRSQEAFSRFKRLREPYALLLVDIDYFKSVNDRFGHDAGDQALRVVAEVLTENTRADIEVPARIGGEEFAVFCYGDISPRALKQVAERLREKVATRDIILEGISIRITASIGGATSDSADTRWDQIYRRADRALYEAKERGRNRVVIA